MKENRVETAILDCVIVGASTCIIFDFIYLNGFPLHTLSLRESRRLLKDNFSEVDNRWRFSVGIEPESITEIELFLTDAIQAENCTGIMIKNMNGIYEIGGYRSINWLAGFESE